MKKKIEEISLINWIFDTYEKYNETTMHINDNVYTEHML